ncbi:hypothetical protein PILCRDRAFT_257682 [Piloderma croceum F 1598]|uniref:Uncharacterized protein n=1 Tax=Piloderma croceum (strain F 1598) TaxID=765440 RepID=A0A0C3G9R3_PILCF|nr:hypothetical protein PILCRDRAFT_257682 [Piloderma croceum F 1598]
MLRLTYSIARSKPRPSYAPYPFLFPWPAPSLYQNGRPFQLSPSRCRLLPSTLLTRAPPAFPFRSSLQLLGCQLSRFQLFDHFAC